MHYQQIKPTPSANKHSPLPALFFSFTTHTHRTSLGTDCMENLLAPRLKFQSKYCVGFPCRILFENCKRKVQKQERRRKNSNDSAAFVNGFAPLRLHFGIFIGKGCWSERKRAGGERMKSLRSHKTNIINGTLSPLLALPLLSLLLRQ